ncbi:UNVERIFIED_CONTAM: hypothetical protein FKN15_032878 [Acipenser sinensis]
MAQRWRMTREHVLEMLHAVDEDDSDAGVISDTGNDSNHSWVPEMNHSESVSEDSATELPAALPVTGPGAEAEVMVVEEAPEWVNHLLCQLGKFSTIVTRDKSPAASTPSTFWTWQPPMRSSKFWRF